MAQRPAESQHLLALLESLRGALRATPPRCVETTFSQLSAALPALLAVLRACRHSALHTKLLLKVTLPTSPPCTSICCLSVGCGAAMTHRPSLLLGVSRTPLTHCGY